jgi:hypothetical protein
LTESSQNLKLQDDQNQRSEDDLILEAFHDKFDGSDFQELKLFCADCIVELQLMI